MEMIKKLLDQDETARGSSSTSPATITNDVLVAGDVLSTRYDDDRGDTDNHAPSPTNRPISTFTHHSRNAISTPLITKGSGGSANSSPVFSRELTQIHTCNMRRTSDSFLTNANTTHISNGNNSLPRRHSGTGESPRHTRFEFLPREDSVKNPSGQEMQTQEIARNTLAKVAAGHFSTGIAQANITDCATLTSTSETTNMQNVGGGIPNLRTVTADGTPVETMLLMPTECVANTDQHTQGVTSILSVGNDVSSSQAHPINVQDAKNALLMTTECVANTDQTQGVISNLSAGNDISPSQAHPINVQDAETTLQMPIECVAKMDHTQGVTSILSADNAISSSQAHPINVQDAKNALLMPTECVAKMDHTQGVTSILSADNDISPSQAHPINVQDAETTLLMPTECVANTDQHTQGVTSILSAGNDVSPSQALHIDAEEERIRQEEISLDKKKLKLYLEAMKVHGNQGGDRKFSNYWEALGRYLSTGDNVRSDSDEGTQGVDAILNAFLKTKKLRKLHNIYVMAVMKQCLQMRSSEGRICDHVPLQWRTQVKKIARKRKSGSSLHEVGSGVDHIIHPIQQEFNVQSSAFQNCGSSAIMLDHASQTKTEIPALESNRYQSPRLPGMLEIGHLSQQVTGPNGLSLSKSAQWVAVIAIREFLSNIIEKTMMHFQVKDTTSSGSRKRRRISNYDLSQVMDDSVSNTRHFPFPASSRIAWEHFTLNSNIAIANPSNVDLDHYQNTINNLIEETTTNSIENKRKTPSRPGSAAIRSRLGKGKDLMAMRARHSKPQEGLAAPTQDELELKSMLSDQDLSTPSDRSVTSRFGEILNPSLLIDADIYNSTSSRQPSVTSMQSNLRKLQRDSFGDNAVSGDRNSLDFSVSRNSSPLVSWPQDESRPLSAFNGSRRHSTGASVKFAGSSVEVLPTRPQSTSSVAPRRPSSSGSSSRRGRGAKDLRRMLARNKSK